MPELGNLLQVDLFVGRVPSHIRDTLENNAHNDDPSYRNPTRQRTVGRNCRYGLKKSIEQEEANDHILTLKEHRFW